MLGKHKTSADEDSKVVNFPDVSLPVPKASVFGALARRLLAAMSVLAGTVLIVYLDREGYRDNADPTGAVDLLDSIYYTTVTLSTTGYGDIAPVSPQARMINAFVITPARIAFLVLLIGTTLEVLAVQGREQLRLTRWRKKMGNHVVVIGFGTKGRSAIATLNDSGVPTDQIVVIDNKPEAVEDARKAGFAVVTGDATKRDIQRQAGVRDADQVIIATGSDAANVLATLTARRLASEKADDQPLTRIVAAVSQQENTELIKRSGADAVITSSDAVGRLIGLSTFSPMLGEMMEDLLNSGSGLEVASRELLVNEVGRQPQSLPDQVIGVVRDEKLYRYFDPNVGLLARGDKLIVVRSTVELPWAPRPGTHNEDFATDVED